MSYSGTSRTLAAVGGHQGEKSRPGKTVSRGALREFCDLQLRSRSSGQSVPTVCINFRGLDGLQGEGFRGEGRPAAAGKLMKALQPGDVVIVTKLDRLGRSTRELLNLLHQIDEAGAAFKSLGDPLFDTTTSQGRLLSTMLAAFASFERDLIRERTGEGRKRAMACWRALRSEVQAVGLSACRSAEAACGWRGVAGGHRAELRGVCGDDIAAGMTVRTLLAVAVAGVLAVPAMAAEIRPDPNKTGGSVEYHTPVQVCGHSSEHRHFSNALRDEVLQRYGLPPGPHPDYEIDHLVPVCLGGGNDVSNLWPQPRRSIEPKWNAEAKDRLETVLCDLVCDGLLDIGDAQEAIIKDWIAAYHLYNE